MARITQNDVDDENARRLLRLARLGRVIGFAVVVGSVIAFVAWIWFAVRSQQRGPGFQVGFGERPDYSFIDRIDVFSTTAFYLVWSVTGVAVGFGLLLASSHLCAASGGGLGKEAVGDPILPPEDDDSIWAP